MVLLAVPGQRGSQVNAATPADDDWPTLSRRLRVFPERCSFGGSCIAARGSACGVRLAVSCRLVVGGCGEVWVGWCWRPVSREAQAAVPGVEWKIPGHRPGLRLAEGPPAACHQAPTRPRQEGVVCLPTHATAPTDHPVPALRRRSFWADADPLVDPAATDFHLNLN